ncbi:MAG TPA: 2,3-bisphosphoglycerate-dependent phosphoglycerate mutase, partial [Pseudodesulfovibrio sp.]|nr:2,3-bisphosphoglycerate-dependent phosphoglycerate mutase [Pseudodesulfovibrio sp.]
FRTMDLFWIPVTKDWRLNERHYGALQGLNKSQTQEQYGPEQVHLWRRGYAVRPPALDEDDYRHPRFDPRYKALGCEQLPATESLQDTLPRVMACWEQRVVPCLERGETPLIAAHGNSLRALIKELDGISDEDVMDLNLPTGIPLVYEFDSTLQVKNRYYLAEPAQVEAALHGTSQKHVAAMED